MISEIKQTYKNLPKNQTKKQNSKNMTEVQDANQAMRSS